MDTKVLKKQYTKKVLTPKHLEVAGKKARNMKVFLTSIRRIGDGVYMNFPIGFYAKIHNAFPLGGEVYIARKGEDIILSRQPIRQGS